MTGVDLDRLRRQVMSNQEAARAAEELRAAREVVEAVRPYVKQVPDDLQSLPDRPLASALAAYDKVVGS